MDLQEFNSAPADRLRPMLAACCDVPRWVDGILAKRPYGDLAALTAVADQTLRELDDDEVDRALQAHPRIGDRAAGRRHRGRLVAQGTVRRRRRPRGPRGPCRGQP